MNRQIIQEFRRLLQHIEAENLAAISQGEADRNQEFRIKAIKKVIKILEGLKFDIKSGQDVKGIAGIGDSTRRRIDEIIKQGFLSDLQSESQSQSKSPRKTRTSQLVNNIQTLMGIIGIGKATAKKLVLDYGITNVSMLRQAIKSGKIKPTTSMTVGLKYHGKIFGAIPRAETKLIARKLARIAAEIDPDLEIVICGSYRRGKATSGDIDVLLYHALKVKHQSQITNAEEYGLPAYMELFIQAAIRAGLLIDHFNSNFRRKYMGLVRYQADYPIRRIDIRFIAYENLAAAMLHHTGPFELNTAMSQKAIRMRMKLNEYGIYRIINDDDLELIPTPTEKDIFRVLKMPYLTPTEREGFNEGRSKKTRD